MATVADLRAPLLVLHGTADTTVPVQQVREYEQTARRLGKPVEAHYYEGAEHRIWYLPQSAEDARRRTVAFLGRSLAGPTAAPAGLPRTGGPGGPGRLAALAAVGAGMLGVGGAGPALRRRGPPPGGARRSGGAGRWP
jgi:hypothetical protein